MTLASPDVNVLHNVCRVGTGPVPRSWGVTKRLSLPVRGPDGRVTILSLYIGAISRDAPLGQWEKMVSRVLRRFGDFRAIFLVVDRDERDARRMRQDDVTLVVIVAGGDR